MPQLKRDSVVCWQYKIAKPSEDPTFLGAKNAKNQKSPKRRPEQPPQPSKQRQVGPTKLSTGGAPYRLKLNYY